jgi:hypothetical protein
MSEVCVVCEKPLDDGRPVQTSFEGEGAHVECLETVEEDEERE